MKMACDTVLRAVIGAHLFKTLPGGNLNFSPTVAGITNWLKGTIKGKLSYIPPKFKDLVHSSH